MRREWYARQVCRVAVEIAEDFNWAAIDPDSPRAGPTPWNDLRRGDTGKADKA